MRTMQADEFGKPWEYDKAKREERTKSRSTRDKRKGRKGIWQPVGADE